MNSCLYECAVMHRRVRPREHRFVYRLFQFALDLDELDTVARRFRGISRNRFNLYAFRDDDHLRYGEADVRSNVEAYLRAQGLATPPGRITLLTSLRTLGYIFNPVSFYFVDDAAGAPWRWWRR